MNIIYFFLFILILNIFFNKPNIENNKNVNPYLWLYWENIKTKKTPTIIKLCIESIKNHCKKDFNIILLNEKTIYNYLPNLRKDLDNLLIAQKVDYIRIALLYKYGGIYMDADTIVVRSLLPIIKKLKYYDFVGFGCTGKYCSNGYPRPSNGVMASRKNSILMKKTLEDLNIILNNKKLKYSYFSLGKNVIWRNISKLQNTSNYKYYHYDSSYDGTRMINKRWVRYDYYLNNNIKLLNEQNLFFIMLTNTGCNNKKVCDKLFSMSKKELLNSNTFISRMFRKSFN